MQATFNEQNSKDKILQGVSHMQFKESKGETAYNLKIVWTELLKLWATCNGKKYFAMCQPHAI